MSVFSDLGTWIENFFSSASTDATDLSPVISAGETLISEVATVVTAIQAGQLLTVVSDANQLVLDVEAFASAVEKFVTVAFPAPAPVPAPSTNVKSLSVVDTFKTIFADGEKIIADLTAIVAAMKNGLISTVVVDVNQTVTDIEAFVAAIESLASTASTLNVKK